jgi:hypothetical protein
VTGEIIWEDGPNEPAKVQLWNCWNHVHLVVRLPTPDIGYHVVLPAGEAITLARQIVNGIEEVDAHAEYDTSAMYIA